MRKLIAGLIIISLLLSFNLAFAASAQTDRDIIRRPAVKVIGEATIKKGTELLGAIFSENAVMRKFMFKAFEDQTLYITEKIDASEESPGGYLLDGTGFIHHCPTHGREPMPEEAYIAVRMEQVESGAVTIRIFK